jgi:hypothetical protein
METSLNLSFENLESMVDLAMPSSCLIARREFWAGCAIFEQSDEGLGV